MAARQQRRRHVLDVHLGHRRHRQIAYGGNGSATIDLRPATLDNSPTGGGFISRVTDATTAAAFTAAAPSPPA